jgi:uncharacterized membrane protein HdeD (DUF308 family)
MSATDPAALSLTGRFPMVRAMAKGWWVFALRGVVAILFGILILANPGVGLAFVLGMLAAWMLIDGVSTLYQAITGPAERHGFWFWADGVVSILAGVAILAAPPAAALLLVYLTGFWAIITGAIRIYVAFGIGSILLGFLGAISVFFGVWMVANPGPGLLVLIWLIAFEAIMMGVVMLGFGWRLRKIANDPHASDVANR